MKLTDIRFWIALVILFLLMVATFAATGRNEDTALLGVAFSLSLCSTWLYHKRKPVTAFGNIIVMIVYNAVLCYNLVYNSKYGTGITWWFLLLVLNAVHSIALLVMIVTHVLKQRKHKQNKILNCLLFFAGLQLFTLTSCDHQQKLTDNYAVFTYGEGLYGESEKDYPVFVSKLGYAGEPDFIPNVKQVWWNNQNIIIEQENQSWWIIAAKDKELTSGDTFYGPLTVHQKDSVMLVNGIDTDEMEYKKL